jgi:hypothetical protein
MSKSFIGSLLVIPVLILALSSFSNAQQPARVPRIGLLVSVSPSVSAPRVKAFQLGLRELGYVERRNIIIEYRYADGKLDPLRTCGRTGASQGRCHCY